MPFLMPLHGIASFHIDTVATLPAQPSDCIQTEAVVSFHLMYSSHIHDSTVIKVNGTNVGIGIYVTDPGGIGLPVLTLKYDTVSAGLLPAGTYTITTRYFLNLITQDTQFGSWVVGTCCSANSQFNSSTLAPCVGATTAFTGSGSPSQLYQWTVNGLNAGTSSVLNYVFNAAGVYNVKLMASDSGCSTVDSVSVTASVCCAVQSNFTFAPNPPCKNDTVTFTGTSSGNPTTFNWLINGNSAGTTPNLTQVFTSGGIFSVSLITGDSNCSDTMSVSVNVAGPDAAFGTIESAILTITFNDSSSNAVSWFWEFGDGATDTIQNPVHTYSYGTYIVCLTVTDSSGCKDSVCESVDAFYESLELLNIPKTLIFPNPVSAQIVTIVCESNMHEIKLFDAAGRLLVREDGNGSRHLLFSIGIESSGIYFLKIETEKGQLNRILEIR